MVKTKITLFAIVTIFASSLSAQQYSYKLNGTVCQVVDGKTVYLKAFNEDKTNFVTLDSTKVKNNSFSFEETLDGDSKLRFIEVTNPSESLVYFITEKGNIQLDLTDSTQKLAGTRANQELQDLQNNEKDLSNQLKLINKRKDLSETEYRKIMNSLVEKTKQYRFDYIQKNIDTEQGEFMFLGSFQMFPADTVMLLVDQTKLSFQNSDAGKQIIGYYKPQLTRIKGANFIDIQLTDIDGKEVKLSDYIGKGKIVLLDFWASWCGPCIKEMPSLVSLYQKYKDRGLEIVGVSLDEKEHSWKNAVDRLNITWPQMSDLKGWKSSVVELYGVYSIPLTILIDRDGTIIDQNIQGKELTDKLDELLK